MSFRRVVSLTLLLAIVMMLTTSIVLYIVPQGRVAYWSNWQLWGLSKTQWGNLHTNAGLLMLIAASFHVSFNWRPITSYMKNKARDFRLFTPNFNAALGVMAVVAVLTLWEMPPMAWIQSGGESIKDAAAFKLGEPPYGHAEESGFGVFVRNTGLDKDETLANLATIGVTVDDPGVLIADLAREAGLSPRELFEIMQGPEVQRSNAPQAIPTAMPMGSGRLTLVGFCEKYNRDLAGAVRILEAKGLVIDPQETLRDIAAGNDMEPLDVLDVLRQGYGEK